eukprot:2892453-Pyramimonas_sp.AAC.1
MGFIERVISMWDRRNLTWHSSTPARIGVTPPAFRYLPACRKILFSPEDAHAHSIPDPMGIAPALHVTRRRQLALGPGK